MLKKQIILGTAGHIDHGKSSLVRALTGIDPDRLEEEKRRGITIELGFAQLELDDINIGLVDVPGHEKFVRTMVAGATGIDLVMLVIAADEGIMPQTREHLDICTLLGVQHGFVALSKIDLVDEEWLALVKDDIQQALQGSFLEDMPLLEVSTKTGTGVEELKTHIGQVARQIESKEAKEMVRLPIDRVFEQKGFGPVVTGTLHTGRLKEGDAIVLLPDGKEGRVRGIQVHGTPTQQAVAGQRTAVNIQGIPLADIHRGQILAQPHELIKTDEFDAKVRLLEHLPKPIKHRAPVLLHAGTIQIPARLWLHAGETELLPGQEGFARITLEQPTVLMPDDRFILRGFQRLEGYGTTLGGGTILDPFPPRRKRHDPFLKTRLQELEQNDPPLRIEQLTKEAGTSGISIDELRRRIASPLKELQSLLSRLLSQGLLTQFEREPPSYIHQESLEQLTLSTQQLVGTYHKEHPLEEGMGREALREQLGIQSPRLFNQLLQKMERSTQLEVLKERVRLPGHAIRLQAQEANVEQRLLDLYREARLTPPRARDLPEALDLSIEVIQPILDYLTRQRHLIRVVEDLFFDGQCLQTLKQDLIQFLQEHGEISAQQFKQLTGASRKFTIPLAEYFDKQKLTLRIGEVRKLRETL